MERTAQVAMTAVETAVEVIRTAGQSLRTAVTPQPSEEPRPHGTPTHQYWWDRDAKGRRPPAGAVELRHDDGPIAQTVKARGCYFPGDVIPSPPGRSISEVLEDIRMKWQRWR